MSLNTLEEILTHTGKYSSDSLPPIKLHAMITSFLLEENYNWCYCTITIFLPWYNLPSVMA